MRTRHLGYVSRGVREQGRHSVQKIVTAETNIAGKVCITWRIKCFWAGEERDGYCVGWCVFFFLSFFFIFFKTRNLWKILRMVVLLQFFFT